MKKLLFIFNLWLWIPGWIKAEPGEDLIVQAPVMEWHKGHGTDDGDHVHYGMQTSDGGYIMVGQTEKDRNGSDMLVVKTDAEGNLEWQKVKGQNRQDEYGTFVTEVDASAGIIHGFIVAGALVSEGQQERTLVKFNAKGNTL